MADSVWDVVVVGAGPAGAATAIRTARAGLRVLLLDRSTFPREKPCGECVSPAALKALARLGALQAVLRQPHSRLAGWSISPVDGDAFQGRFPADEPGIGISRAVLDSVLVEIAAGAGATLRTGTQVMDLLREGDAVVGVLVRSESGDRPIRARVVVGADGLRSVVVRRLGQIRRPPRLRKVALTAHLCGSATGGELGELRLRSFGCIGIADVGGGVTNVVVVLEGDTVQRVGGRAEECFDEAVRAEPRLRGARRLTPVMATGPFDWPTTCVVANGALLVGDAAGYYDPFTGQGIYRALRGAELAAEALIAGLAAGDLSRSALPAYARAHNREFAPGERVQRMIEAVVSRQGLMRIAASRLRRRPELADALVAVTGDLRPVRSLLRPRLLARALV